MAISPLNTAVPGGDELVDSLFCQTSSLVDEIKFNSAPFTTLLDTRFETICLDFLCFIESEAASSNPLKEDFRVVENIFFGADEDDIVDVGVDNFATATREIEKEESCELGSGAGLTLTHAETIGFVVFLALAETKKVSDRVQVRELVVVGSEVEGSEVFTSGDEIADVNLGRELELLEGFLAIFAVDIEGFTKKAEALLGKFGNGEELDPTSNLASWDFSDSTGSFEFIEMFLLNWSLWAAVCSACWEFFVPGDVFEHLVGFHHVLAQFFISVFEFVETSIVESTAILLVVNWPVRSVDIGVDELVGRRALLPV